MSPSSPQNSNTKSRPGFEYCAFGFLAQWLESECALHAAISSAPTENDIRKALAYFQVARTFKGLNTDGAAASILECLLDVRRDKSLPSPDGKVDALANKFSVRFKRNNVSAASKLLWLSYRGPFIVYDARAVKALTRDFGHRCGGYSEYSKAWREEYARCEGAILAAVEHLPMGRMFLRSCSLSDQELLRTAKEAWFTERVFDVFLWEVGAKASE